MWEIDLSKRICSKVDIQNQHQVPLLSYHSAQYLSKFDAMVVVGGKLAVGKGAPMNNTVMIYHFKEKMFQFIDDRANPSPFYRLPKSHIVSSTLMGTNQLAFYGGSSCTDYDEYDKCDKHIYIMSFHDSSEFLKEPGERSFFLYPFLTRIYISERVSSVYNTIIYCKETSSFYLYGGYVNDFTIVTVNFKDTDVHFFALRNMVNKIKTDSLDDHFSDIMVRSKTE